MEYIVEYWDGNEWNLLCSRGTYRKAVIARNQYFGSDSGCYSYYRIIERLCV